MPNKARAERSERLSQRKSGGWATMSQNLLFVVSKLYRLSAEEAAIAQDQKHSPYIYAGLPLLLSAIYSFIIEYEGMLNSQPLSDDLLAKNGLAVLLEQRYGISGNLLEEFRDLAEIRNEIIHPVPLPVGTSDNWPDYLRRVKRHGLLCSTGDPNADYLMLSQMASHSLFKWAVGITERVYDAIVNSDPTKPASYQHFVQANFRTLFG
jgi:hypothetical protein